MSAPKAHPLDPTGKLTRGPRAGVGSPEWWAARLVKYHAAALDSDASRANLLAALDGVATPGSVAYWAVRMHRVHGWALRTAERRAALAQAVRASDLPGEA